MTTALKNDYSGLGPTPMLSGLVSFVIRLLTAREYVGVLTRAMRVTISSVYLSASAGGLPFCSAFVL